MKRFIRVLAALAIVSCISFLILEIALRAFAPFYSPSLRAFVKEEAYLGAQTALRVARGTQIILKKSDFEKGADIVVVGDSMAFGSLSRKEHAWPTVLAERTGLEVLNLGVASNGPCASNYLLRSLLPLFPRPPRLVIYSLFANDILEGPCYGDPVYRRVFIWDADYRHDTKLQLRRAREWVFQHSVLYQLFKHLVTARKLVYTKREFSTVYFRKEDIEFLFVTPGYWSYLDIDNSKGREGMERTLEKVQEAADIVRASGSDFVVLLIPFKEQTYVRWLTEEGLLAREYYSPAYDLSYDMLAGKLAAMGVRTIDLRPPFVERAREGAKLYLTLDGHFTPEGNRLVAETLAGIIEDTMPAVSP
jgi:hypothetical protein